MRFSLQSRIFTGLGALTIISLLVVWFVIRPEYEKSILQERITVVQQLQSYAIENLDRQIGEWLTATHAVAWQLKERPREGENLLRNTMTLHPEIIRIRVNSPGMTDELVSQNIGYAVPTLQPKDSVFVSSSDTLIQVAWITNSNDSPTNAFITRTYFKIEGSTFLVTVLWDAQALQQCIARLPFGTDYLVGIFASSFVVYKNREEVPTSGVYQSDERANRFETIKLGNERWYVLSSAFQNARYQLFIAVPESVIRAPVNSLLVYSSSFIVVLSLVLLLLGWILSFQVSKPIGILVRDIEQLRNLDFTQGIRIPAMIDLRKIGETVELMRQSLERYQRLNVEKIILEEWKNKLFMMHSDDLIGFTDGEGRFVFRNTSFDEFCSSLPGGESFTTKDQVLKHPEVSKIKETIRNETADSFIIHFIQSELKVQLHPETEHYYRVNDLSILRKEEKIGSLIIFHDMTNDRLIDKMKTDLMHVVVHELRNPVGSIMGFADILLHQHDVDENEQKEFLTHILNSSKNLNVLINRFLDISRLESHQIVYQKKMSDVVGIVREIIESQRPQLLRKDLKIEIDIVGLIPQVCVAPDLFREAVVNLVSNAIKYGDSNRTINIRLEQKEGSLIFMITDHGYGIPPEAQEKLFSKFYRVASNKKALEEVGTGLGLAYVKEIAGYHNGSIALESNEKIGCQFTLTIPIEEKSVHQED